MSTSTLKTRVCVWVRARVRMCLCGVCGVRCGSNDRDLAPQTFRVARRAKRTLRTDATPATSTARAGHTRDAAYGRHARAEAGEPASDAVDVDRLCWCVAHTHVRDSARTHLGHGVGVARGAFDLTFVSFAGQPTKHPSPHPFAFALSRIGRWCLVQDRGPGGRPRCMAGFGVCSVLQSLPLLV